MTQLALFETTATAPEIAIPCYWGNVWCHDCGWCDGGLLLAAEKAKRAKEL